ncbi:hypothetical protein DFH09DRAFT_1324968 [Mycena vulgaris]|nr:hypothetical protein DFH09DRAFT_1324968 [Mycena vulgaris]
MSSPPAPVVSSAPQQGSTPSESSNWLADSLLAAKTITAAAECAPFPHIKGSFGLVVILLETVEKVKKNQDDLKELFGDIMEIVTIVWDQLVVHGAKAAVNFKNNCEKFASVLQDILKAVLSSNADQIEKHQKEIQNLRSNLNLLVTIDTNFKVDQIQETLAIALPKVEAEELLLKSAGLELTPANRKVAAEIVKALCYLALAIIQAGAFIAVSEDLAGYLESYAQNRARLLSEKPTQSHDDYAWTVYTTWQISFDRLSEPAAAMLRLWSFLHHNGISEAIFSNASKYTCETSGPSQDELEKPFQFLSQFLGPTGSWDSLRFRDITKEIQGYSLISYDQGKKLFSMHPLVHGWCRDTLLDPEPYRYCMSAILGMAINQMPDSSRQVDCIQLLPHVQALARGDGEIKPDFQQEYAEVYRSAGLYENVAQLVVIVVERQGMILGKEHPDTLSAMNDLAITYSNLGRLQEAEEFQVEVLEKQRKILGREHPYTLSAMNNLANTYAELGRLQEAEELQVEVLEKRGKILGWEHPYTLSAMNNLATTYFKVGRSQEAEELQAKVLEKRRKILGGEHPGTLDAMNNLAHTYSELGRSQKAEELRVEVLEKRRKILGREHPVTLDAMNNLAHTYSELGRWQEAEELQMEVLEKRRKILGEKHPDTLGAMNNLAHTYFKVGRSQEAEELQVEALEKRRKILGEDHPDTLTAMNSFGYIYSELGRLREAKELQVEVLEKRSQIPVNNLA